MNQKTSWLRDELIYLAQALLNTNFRRLVASSLRDVSKWGNLRDVSKWGNLRNVNKGET